MGRSSIVDEGTEGALWISGKHQGCGLGKRQKKIQGGRSKWALGQDQNCGRG